jgi:hypothetical protein
MRQDKVWKFYCKTVVDGQLHRAPKGPGCEKCYVMASCWPLLKFSDWAVLYKSDQKVRAASLEALRRYETGDFTDISQAEVIGIQSAALRIQCEYFIFNEREFLRFFKTTPEALGLKMVSITNEKNELEDVVVMRDESVPRKAIVYTEHGNSLEEQQVRQLLRPGQASDCWAKATDLLSKHKMAAMPSGKRRLKLVSIQSIRAKACNVVPPISRVV